MSERRYVPTLCWQCGKALGGCSWSDGSFRPVEGWMALPTEQPMEDGDAPEIMRSYCVYGCPLFERG